MTETRIVDNRTLLLGLDELYRKAMKVHERSELLACAKRVAAALDVAPAKQPVEGYYTEAPALAEYFLLMRALQALGSDSKPKVAALPEFQRLSQVTTAPLYGKPSGGNSLLPAGRDALAQALKDTAPRWNARRLVDAAHDAAVAMDDFSLVGLAARIKDAVVLAATRESTVLYAELLAGAAIRPTPPQYVWRVDEALAVHARRFVDAFNTLFNDNLPPPEAAEAAAYWAACRRNRIDGRCVRIGYDDTVTPHRNYHWAIYRARDGALALQEFWSSDLWTTERYRTALRQGSRPPRI